MIRILRLAPLFLMFAAHSVFGQTAPTRSITLDIPIRPIRKTIHIQRIIYGNLNLGPSIDPWGKNLIHRINLAPELTIAGSDNRLHVTGGFASAHDEGRRRDDSFLDVAVDRRVWNFSAGAAGFVEGEKVDKVYEIVDITTDFSRLSLGIKFWSGFKRGSFSGDFFVVNAGGGYLRAKGNVINHHPILKDIEPSTLYKEGFYIYNLKAEGQKVYPRVSGHIKIEGVGYVRQSSFYDLNFQSTLEVWPLKRFRSARLLVRGNSNFKKYDGLLFRTSEPEIQVYLRIKIR